MLLARVIASAFLKEQHVGLYALGVEDTCWQSQDGVQVALVHQVAANIGADAGFEQYVVRQYHSSSAARFQASVNMLKEGQLLVAGLVSQVITGRATAAFGCAERRVGENYVNLGQVGPGLAEGVAQMHHPFFITFHAVEQGVHKRQATGTRYQLNADKGTVTLEGLGLGIEVIVVVGLAFDIGVGGNQETSGTRSRVLDGLSWLGLDAVDDAVDQRARREVLPCTGFGFAGVLFQQAFVKIAQAITASAEPVDPVQALDQLLQMARFLHAGLRIGINGGDQRVAVLAQVQQHLTVVVEQVKARLASQVRPARAYWQFVGKAVVVLYLLVFHLDKQQQYQLGDVVAVVDAIVAQYVAKVPEFLDDVGVGHG
ncbi:hypothetical protein ALP90_05675 [Pseudomonas amygdali pv. ulmi]|uniref:Uncharacterized protein n=1 Tax=Pseudomonas amygdali pv. ulmi TaxID=251720 RepID=A0A3M4TFS5_PSEA0|nr:hypothetical protein ALP90_05675 [Pseudomonas amygdali pv. ulmi]